MNLSGETRRHLEDLAARSNEFSGAFMAVHGLTSLLSSHPELATLECVQGLGETLHDTVHHSQSRAFYLYRMAAEGLAQILDACPDPRMAAAAMDVLEVALNATSGPARKACAETLGSLPIALCGKPMQLPPLPASNRLPSLDAVLRLQGLCPGAPCKTVGRSTVYPLTRTTLLVVKFARKNDCLSMLNREGGWMQKLGSLAPDFPASCDVPHPLLNHGSHLCRAEHHAPKDNGAPDLRQDRVALPFIAPRSYFAYPNDHRPEKHLEFKDFEAVLERNATLLAHLLGKGYHHSAPIPLFHNRVQRERRRDLGLYEWHRGGRLDRWLDSCRYPNFGKSGLRDLEHIEPVSDGGPIIYRAIGTHLLSLVLVLGSYFRNRRPELRGLEPDGTPVDARHLFDRGEVLATLQTIFNAYFTGFVGSPYAGALPVDLEQLTDRLTEEMGIDRHMTETLRIQDQLRMDRETFCSFLTGRGYSKLETGRLIRGARDIDIVTGPHLGGFNQPISLPELVEAIASMSALYVLGRYRRIKNLPV